jgi:hypothetical protein
MNVSARITGLGEVGLDRASGRSPIELATEAAMMALGDAGLALFYIDGICVGRGGDLFPDDRLSLELSAAS